MINIKMPLSEGDILLLEDIFLKNGIHRLKFANLEDSRFVVASLLSALGCYNKIAFIGDDAIIKNSDFCFDFLYIEKSDKILKQSWYKKFCKDLKFYQIDRAIPIIEVEI